MSVSVVPAGISGSWRASRILVVLAFAWLALMAVAAIGADVLSPHPYLQTHLLDRLLPPFHNFSNPLGTDNLGRDVFSRLLRSIRMSALIVVLGAVVGAGFGIALGAVAAYFRGLVDDLIMVLVDFQAAVPMLIIALAVLAFLGNDLTLFIIMVGLSGWERYARIMRGLSLALQEQGFATAVRSFGGSPARLYLRHILPNAAAPLLVNLTLNFPELLMLESGLSFIGLGVQPPNTSLGNMVGFGREYLTTAWWIAVLPGVIIAVTTIAISIIGDWLRDRLDPTLQN
jgi:peptide/nickel transport system permease protein